MEWWTHLWLNEGFATWIQYMCVDKFLPELDVWTTFVSNEYCNVLTTDSLRNSHPVEITVGSPKECDEIFDAISYSKGACTIRMLHNYIGDEVYKRNIHLFCFKNIFLNMELSMAKAFKSGVNEYLEKFKFKNTVSEDLWIALSNASKKPVKEIMEMWTKQTGFPAITVNIRA